MAKKRAGRAVQDEGGEGVLEEGDVRGVRPELLRGEVEEVEGVPPAFWYGALMQWLNPKAWLAASMGMGAYGIAGGMSQIAFFAGIYLVICLGSIACWAYAGSRLQGWLVSPRRLRWFNRAMALLLLLSAAYLVRSS